MIEIQLSDDDRLDWALKSFKKKVQKAGILADLRRKRHYTKPSAEGRGRSPTPPRGGAQGLTPAPLFRRARPAGRPADRGRRRLVGTGKRGRVQ